MENFFLTRVATLFGVGLIVLAAWGERAVPGGDEMVAGIQHPEKGSSLRAEAEVVIEHIYARHPLGIALKVDSSFQSRARALVAQANDFDVPRFGVRMMELLTTIGDGHTVLIPYSLKSEEFQTRLPVRLMRFEDGYYVTAATPAAAPLLGARVTAVAGVPVDEIIRRFAAVQPKDNLAWAARWAHLALAVPGLLVGLDVIGVPDAPVIAIEGQLHRERVILGVRSVPVEVDEFMEIDRVPTAANRWLTEEGTRNFIRVLGQHRALYVSFGSVGDTEGRRFEVFMKQWVDAIERAAVDRMVVDLRSNGGGDNMLAEPIRRHIVRSRFNRLGRLYVLTDPGTFSAAQNFATRLERETDALFVGEPTGGRPNHFGDPEVLEGPATGGTYLVSTLRWQDSSPFDDRPWILPDIPVAPSFADYLAGRDRVLDAALSHVVKGDEEPERWAEPWNRASQKAAWSFFWEHRSQRDQ